MNDDAADGLFVVFEGIDGSGTTTQCERLAAHLRSRRRLVQVTREPSAGPIGSQLRLVLTRRIALPLAQQAQVMALLFAADRLDHVETDVAPHLRDGYIVISDRYDLSSLCYQAIASEVRPRSSPDDVLSPSGAPPSGPPSIEAAAPSVAWIRELNRYARRPDVTVVLDVSPHVAAQRRKLRGGAVELFEDPDLQRRLAEVYRCCDALVPGDHVVHINGDGDPAAVQAEIAAVLEPIVFRGARASVRPRARPRSS